MLFLYCKTKLGVRAFKRSGHRTSPSKHGKGSIIKHTTKTFQSQVITLYEDHVVDLKQACVIEPPEGHGYRTLTRSSNGVLFLK